MIYLYLDIRTEKGARDYYIALDENDMKEKYENPNFVNEYVMEEEFIESLHKHFGVKYAKVVMTFDISEEWYKEGLKSQGYVNDIEEVEAI